MSREPFHLILACLDRTGRQFTATVVITQDSARFRWHATLADTGQPPAELLGACGRLEDVKPTVRAKVARMQASGVLNVGRRETDSAR